MKNIKYDWHDENINDRKKCCNLEVKFENSTYISYSPNDLESDNIIDKIRELKENLYVNNKSIKIDSSVILLLRYLCFLIYYLLSYKNLRIIF